MTGQESRESPMADPVTEQPSVNRAEETLLDRYLPNFDAARREHIVVDADVPTTWRALVDLDLLAVHSPLVDAAIRVRDLPRRVGVLFGRQPVDSTPANLRMGRGEMVEGWLSLGRRELQEVAFGAIGVFWRPKIVWREVADPEEFAAWNQPGTGRIAAAFQLRPYGQTRTLASYEARTAVPDESSRRAFARYWRLVTPFVGVIMRAALRQLKADAERLNQLV